MSPILRATALATLGLLAACGGGDGESPPPSPPPPPPPAPVPPPPPPPAASFSIALAQTKVLLQQGENATVQATVTRENGFSGAIDLSLVELPAGVSAQGASVPANSNQATLTLSAQATAPHSLPTSSQARGASGTTQASTGLTVTVRGPAGSVDTSFATAGKQLSAMGGTDAYATALAVQSDGKAIVVGHATQQAGADFALLRLERDGSLDASFGNGGKLLTPVGAGAASDQAHAVFVQPDGKILVAGSSDSGGNAGLDFAILRYKADGTLDPEFGNGGKVVIAMGGDVDVARALLLQADGKILVAGDSNANGPTSGTDFALARLLANGQLDTSFGNGGKVLTALKSATGRDSVTALVMQNVDGDPRLVAIGGDGDFLAARYQLNGQLDGGFGINGKVVGLFNASIGSANAVVPLGDGRLVLAGHINHDVALVRLSVDGQLDASFGTGGKVITAVSTDNWDQATSLVRQTDGKLLVGGWVNEGAGSAGDMLLLRYSASGQLDAGFGTAGISRAPMAATGRHDAGRALVLQADDRVPTTRVLQAGEAVFNGANGFAIQRFWL